MEWKRKLDHLEEDLTAAHKAHIRQVCFFLFVQLFRRKSPKKADPKRVLDVSAIYLLHPSPLVSTGLCPCLLRPSLHRSVFLSAVLFLCPLPCLPVCCALLHLCPLAYLHVHGTLLHLCPLACLHVCCTPLYLSPLACVPVGCILLYLCPVACLPVKPRLDQPCSALLQLAKLTNLLCVCLSAACVPQNSLGSRPSACLCSL